MYDAYHKCQLLEVCFVMCLGHPPALSEAGEPLSTCFILCPFFSHSFTYAHYCFVERGIAETFASRSAVPTVSYVTVMHRVTFVTHSDKHCVALPSRSVVFEVCFADPKCPVTISQWFRVYISVMASVKFTYFLIQGIILC